MLASKASASAHTSRRRTEALLALRTRRSRKPVLFELLETTLPARLLHAAATELLPKITATLGLAGQILTGRTSLGARARTSRFARLP